MATSKRRPPYGTVRSLYGELEHARREWEDDKASEGGKAFELWLELLDVADWCAGTTSDDDDEETDEVGSSMGSDSADVDDAHDSPSQLRLQDPGGPATGSRGVRDTPGGMERPMADVPRGTGEVRGRAVARAALLTGAREERAISRPDGT